MDIIVGDIVGTHVPLKSDHPLNRETLVEKQTWNMNFVSTFMTRVFLPEC